MIECLVTEKGGGVFHKKAPVFVCPDLLVFLLICLIKCDETLNMYSLCLVTEKVGFM